VKLKRYCVPLIATFVPGVSPRMIAASPSASEIGHKGIEHFLMAAVVWVDII
jgi:hypothetical protein